MAWVANGTPWSVANGDRQARLAEGAFEHRPGRHDLRGEDALARQQEARVLIGNGERKTLARISHE
jgi:hypothetical protein